ncbi:hypothetical protein BH09SUM1_BH09SUM1_24140 [soil metagenome]
MPLNLDKLRLPQFRAALALFCVAWLAAIGVWHHQVVMDDPWITFRYARNLLEGNGLVFNPGERLEGYSNFTWVLVTALSLKANIEPLSFARFASWLSLSAMMSVLVFGWWKPSIPKSELLDGSSPFRIPHSPFPHHSATAAILLASCYPMAIWAMGGLETVFYAMLVLMLTLSTWAASSGNKHAALAMAACLALLPMTRPEGPMWFAIPILAFIAPGTDRKTLLQSCAAAAAVFAVYTAWRWHYFGSLIPNTVRAKVGGSLGHTLWSGIAYMGEYLLGAPLLLVALAGMTIVRTFREDAPRSNRRRFIVLCGAAVMLQVAFILGVGGDWMAAVRFLVPVMAPLCLLAALEVKRWPFFVRGVALTFLLLASALQAKDDPVLRWCRWATSTQPKGTSLTRRVWARMTSEDLIVKPLIEAGLWLRDNAPPDATFAGSEAGIMPYYSRLRFIDMLGLVDAHIAALPGALHQKQDAGYVLGQRPDFIVLGLIETPEGLQEQWGPDREIFHHPDFVRDYVEATRIPRFMDDGEWRLLNGLMIIYRRRE